MTVNDEMERMWKETVVDCFTHYKSICLEGLRITMKTSVNVGDVRAEIRT
jgi:hypothetical protein